MTATDLHPGRSDARTSIDRGRPTVLFVGDLNSRCRSYQRYLATRRVATRVIGISFVSLRGRDQDGPPSSLLERAADRVGWPRDTTGFNRRVLQALHARRFDLLWIDKAPALRPKTLIHARLLRPNLRIAFHSDDDMAARHNASTFFRRCLPHFDVVFTAKSYNAHPRELPAQGARRVVYQPQAFDPEFHRPVRVSGDDRIRLGAEVGFIGTYEAPRARSMLHLARSGISVRVFGNGWAPLLHSHPNLRIENRPVYGEDYIRALCATDVNLGFLRHKNRDLHTSRSLDIPACGAFLLGERTDEHEALFPEGACADYFGSDEELLAKVRHHLSHPADRLRMGAAARERCLAEDMTHDAAMARMLQIARSAETSRAPSQDPPHEQAARPATDREFEGAPT